MKSVLDEETDTRTSGTSVRPSYITSFRPRKSFPRMFLKLIILLAFVTGAGLLLNDLWPSSVALPHAPVSATPLLFIGVASLGFQMITRPRPLDLFKGLLVSVAFILWGIDQMLPAGWLSIALGDVVIVLYVIDLGWMMASALRARFFMPKQTTNPG